jgi:hypothetical protein
MANRPSKIETANTTFTPPPKAMTLADVDNAVTTQGANEGKGKFAAVNALHAIAYGVSSNAITTAEMAADRYKVFCAGQASLEGKSYAAPNQKTINSARAKFSLPFRAIAVFRAQDPDDLDKATKKGMAAWNAIYGYATTQPGRVQLNLVTMGQKIVKEERALTREEMAEIVAKNANGDTVPKTFRATIEAMSKALENIVANKAKSTRAVNKWNVKPEQEKAMLSAKSTLDNLLLTIPKPATKA